MNACHRCGLNIPDAQEVCSMCYGDPFYGTDGYYLEYIQKMEQQESMRREEEQSLYELSQELWDERLPF